MTCVPKLKDVCERAGATSLPKFSRINIGISELITDHWIYLAMGIVLALVFLEWRASNWPRYRRAAIGLTTFILNCSLLISLFLIICTGGCRGRNGDPLHQMNIGFRWFDLIFGSKSGQKGAILRLALQATATALHKAHKADEPHVSSRRFLSALCTLGLVNERRSFSGKPGRDR